MIRSILVPVTGTSADEATFSAALDIARRHGAHLDFLHVRSDPSALATAAGDLGSGVATAELFQALETAAGVFEPRPLSVGLRLEDRYEVLDGLEEGESIVISGNFLIDSESRIQAAQRAARGSGTASPSGSPPGHAGHVP